MKSELIFSVHLIYPLDSHCVKCVRFGWTEYGLAILLVVLIFHRVDDLKVHLLDNSRRVETASEYVNQRHLVSPHKVQSEVHHLHADVLAAVVAVHGEKFALQHPVHIEPFPRVNPVPGIIYQVNDQIEGLILGWIVIARVVAVHYAMTPDAHQSVAIRGIDGLDGRALGDGVAHVIVAARRNPNVLGATERLILKVCHWPSVLQRPAIQRQFYPEEIFPGEINHLVVVVGTDKLTLDMI